MLSREERSFSSLVWGASALLVIWIALWAFFVVAVVEPAARMNVEIARADQRI
jgi:hypothetical protein